MGFTVKVILYGDGLVVSVSASHAIGGGFKRVTPKTIIEMVQNASLLGTPAL